MWKAKDIKKKTKSIKAKSIKTKIVVTVLLVNMITLLAMTLVTAIMSYRIISAGNNMEMINLSDKYASEINGWLTVQGQIVDEIVDSIESHASYDEGYILDYLKQETNENSSSIDIYLGLPDKRFIDGSGWKPPVDYDCTARGWYMSAKESGELSYSSPYLDLITKQMVSTISKSVTIDGKFIGVIGMDINLETMNKIVNNSVSMEGSYAFLLDDKDNIIIHKNEDYLPKEDTLHNLKDTTNLTSMDMLQTIKKKHELKRLKDYDGHNRFLVISNIKATNWKFGIAISEKEYTKPVDQLLKAVSICSITAIIIVILISYMIGDNTTKPIISLTNEIKKQSELDFGNQEKADFMKYMSRKDEIGIITHALIQMQSNVRQLLIQATDSASQVSATAEELTSTSTQSASAAQEVAQTIYEIAKGASEQAVNTEASTLRLMDLGISVDNDKKHIKSLLEETSHVSELVQKALDVVNDLSVNTLENGKAAEAVAQSIIKTNESSEKISEASNFITAVATQTKLLALNAAIEAARAGEQGKGFAVVAEEIRRLAEQSTKSTKIINEIVTELHQDASNAVEKMKEAEIIINAQMGSVKLTKENFIEISEAMKHSKEAVQVLDESSSYMQIRKDELFDLIQNLSAVAQENAASTEEASAAMEEESASIDEIAAASERLSEITTELSLLINKFKL